MAASQQLGVVVAGLLAFSCFSRATATIDGAPLNNRNTQDQTPSQSQQAEMRLKLHEAIEWLGKNGFSTLSHDFEVIYAAELVNLQNMTVFAVDDRSIFTHAESYVSNVKYHIVSNRLLTIADLEKLPVGTLLPTLVSGQSLAVTTAGGSIMRPMRINYVPIKVPDVMRNGKVAVHSIDSAFPHLHHSVSANSYNSSNTDGTSSTTSAESNVTVAGSCAAQYTQEGDCLDTMGMGPTA